MEFIIGGCFQGKSEFARRRYEKERACLLSEEEWFALAADGRRDTWEKAYTAPVLEHLEAYIQRIAMKEGEGYSLVEKKQRILAWLEEVFARNPKGMIVMDEVGCGVVPIQKEAREYRDLAGVAGQFVAGRADAVYRLLMGIEERIR